MEEFGELLDTLWVEKYRPHEIDDIILEESQEKKFRKFISDMEIPHILLHGPPGSGKTTLARITYEKILSNTEMDLMMLNGSEDTGVDTVRDMIVPFLKSSSYGSKHKIVFIDEFDYMSKNAQASLRNVFEKYYENARFICTCNYLSKIEPALLSRFQDFKMERLPDEFIVNFCKKILQNETITFKEDDVQLLVQSLSPDVRKIVNILEQSCENGELKHLDKNSIIGVEKKIIGLIIQICENINNKAIVNQSTFEIQQEVNAQEVDYLSIYQTLFNEVKIPAWGKIEISIASDNHQSCAIPHIHFVAMIYKIIQNGLKFKSLYE